MIDRKKFIIAILGFFISMNISAVGRDDMKTIKLPKPKLKGNVSIEEAISSRRSVRRYSSRRLTDGEISQLLWACQGITSPRGLRAAPSAGALYPLEVYLVKDDGVYKYIPEGHQLRQLSGENVKQDLMRASHGQAFVEKAPVDIVICAVYERVTSRYAERGVRYTDIEAGHAAENVHLEAVSLGLASVPVGAFSDNAVSKVLNLPAREKPIYIIPVGHEER